MFVRFTFIAHTATQFLLFFYFFVQYAECRAVSIFTQPDIEAHPLAFSFSFAIHLPTLFPSAPFVSLFLLKSTKNILWKHSKMGTDVSTISIYLSLLVEQPWNSLIFKRGKNSPSVRFPRVRGDANVQKFYTNRTEPKNKIANDSANSNCAKLLSKTYLLTFECVKMLYCVYFRCRSTAKCPKVGLKES